MQMLTLTVALILSMPTTRAADDLPTQPTSPLAPSSPRDARELGVGSYVPDVLATALDGSERGWRSGRGDQLTVIALTSATCPLCKKFGPSLARIEQAYRDRGVKFVFVNVSGVDTINEMRTQVSDMGWKGAYLNDRARKSTDALASALRAQTTTEVFVVDAGNTLVYRGAVSDQYGVNFTREAPRSKYLEDALDALLAGRAPEIAATSSPGCAIEYAKPATSPATTTPTATPNTTTTTTSNASPAVTYTRDISRIINANCVECHREGGVGPFRLDSYEAVARRATMIRAVTEEGTMPPWFAAPMHGKDGIALESPWANDRSMSEAEKDAILAWIAAGKPEGDPKDLPLPRTFASDEWKIGAPDAVFKLPEPIAVKADGFMPYQNVLVPTNLAADKWVQAVQIVPSDPSVVHHVLEFALDEEAAKDPATRRRLGADEASGYWAAYVPGNDAITFPDGMAKRLPANSSLLFQIHYTPNGKATQDQMRLGVVFADEAPKHLVRTAAVADLRLNIPPGAKNHEENSLIRIPANAKILAFMPHMHVRGKAYRYELEVPGASKRTVLDIPNYDFNWQLRYELREPMDAPRGAVLYGTAWYDNSADNPANPDPTKTVRWGPQTVDEMMLGYIEYYLVDEDPMKPMDLPGRGALRGGAGAGGAAGGAGAGGAGSRALSFETLQRQFDKNDDGRIEKSEVAPALHRRFDQLDTNKDAVLTKDDFPA
jgi:thiol-disulfide isomerase/thioredoxin/mono/diheme cytochrome c family protein